MFRHDLFRFVSLCSIVKYRITAPHTLSCKIALPPSKSISNRALIIGALARCISSIENLAICNDTAVLAKALQAPSPTIDINNAGTAMRFLTAYLAATPSQATLTGSARMMQRPIAPLVEALQQLGATISYVGEQGYPPLHIEGSQLKGGAIAIRGDISSQFISALLLVAPYMQQGLHLTLKGNILSRPYIDMTIALMRHYGAIVTTTERTIEVAPVHYTRRPLTIEGDYSAASYWYAIAALNGKSYQLDNLSRNSVQGDSRVAQYFALLGVDTIYHSNGIEIIPRAAYTPPEVISLDLCNEPDLAQTLIMCCALKQQHFHISGLHNLRIKETDRIAALISQAHKLGYLFTQPHEGCIAWHGEHCQIQHPIIIDTCNDHRMAMAFAPAALRWDEIWIDNPGVVEKSYPQFWNDLQQAGFTITPQE